MKKTVQHLMLTLFLLLAFVSVSSTSFGATTVTYSGVNHIGNGVYILAITYTDDTAGTTGTAITLPAEYSGMQILCALHDPGGTALTDTADIHILWNEVDVLGGGLDNCGGTANTSADFVVYAPLWTSLKFYLANNAVNNATGVVYLFMVNVNGNK